MNHGYGGTYDEYMMGDATDPSAIVVPAIPGVTPAIPIPAIPGLTPVTPPAPAPVAPVAPAAAAGYSPAVVVGAALAGAAAIYFLTRR